MFGLDHEPLDEEIENPLEASNFFETPIEAGEAPKLRSDVKIIATLESNIESMQFLLHDIQSTRGMDQGFALEAAKYSEDFKETPIGYFTKSATQTRYQVSIESLLSTIKAALVKIFNLIRDALRRALAWLVGLFKGKEKLSESDYNKAKDHVDAKETSNLASWATVVNSLDQAANDYNTLRSKTGVLPTVAEKSKIPLEAFLALELQDEARVPYQINMLLTQEDPLLYDYIYHGAYSQLMEILSAQTIFVLRNASLKLSRFKAVFRETAMVSKDLIRNEDFNELVSGLGHALKSRITMANENLYTTEAVIKEINETREKAKNATHGGKIPLPEVIQKVLGTHAIEYSTQREKALTECEKEIIEIESSVSVLAGALESLQFGESLDRGNDKLITTLRTNLMEFSKDLNNYVIILRYIRIHLNSVFFLYRDIGHYLDIFFEYLAKNSDSLQKTDSEELREVVRHVGNRKRDRFLAARNFGFTA